MIGIALLAWLACGQTAERPVQTSPGAVAPVFPHPDGYDAAGHGADAALSPSTCLSCHGIDEGDEVRGGPAVAPACRSCHTDYPHVADYGRVSDHGTDWLARGTEDCAGCHGPGGDQVPSAVCTGCHSTYPHPEGWREGTGHGAARLARTPAACAGCHGPGDDDRGRCDECHTDYPHPPDFAAPDAHGAAWRADGASCTETCHPAQAEAPKVACTSCHDLFPHPPEWPEGHLVVIQGRGEGACVPCHAPGTPAGPAMPVSCAAACHGGAP